MACKKDQLQQSLATEYTVRNMTKADIDAVLRIEQSAYGFPWTEGIFRDCLRVGYHSFVAERDGLVVGYVLMNTVLNEGHILNLCVDPSVRRQGIARRLLQSVIELALQLEAATLFLEVRESNTAALALYADFGFNEIGIRRNYYPAPVGREDAIMLVKQLNLEGIE